MVRQPSRSRPSASGPASASSLATIKTRGRSVTQIPFRLDATSPFPPRVAVATLESLARNIPEAKAENSGSERGRIKPQATGQSAGLGENGMNVMAQGPLSGLKIVEFAGIGPAPFCGMLLSD